ncbi:hypothetical protein GEMRC1_003084 [Eukaryota sp. GEM-RC1]
MEINRDMDDQSVDDGNQNSESESSIGKPLEADSEAKSPVAVENEENLHVPAKSFEGIVEVNLESDDQSFDDDNQNSESEQSSVDKPIDIDSEATSPVAVHSGSSKGEPSEEEVSEVDREEEENSDVDVINQNDESNVVRDDDAEELESAMDSNSDSEGRNQLEVAHNQSDDQIDTNQSPKETPMLSILEDFSFLQESSLESNEDHSF